MTDESTITIYDNDDTVLPVRITSDGSAYDITGHTLSWLFCGRNTVSAKYQLDVTDHDDPSAGLSSLTITPVIVAEIGGVGNYTVFGIDVDGSGNEITRASFKLAVAHRPSRT